MGGVFTHMLGLNPTAGGTVYANSVQQVTVTIASGSATGTATISTVGSGAFILWGGQSTASTANMATGLARITLTNSTTITATRNTSVASAITIKCVVVDATSALVNSVQYGSCTFLSTDTSKTATISAVNNSYSVVHLLGWTTGGTVTAFNTSEPLVSLSGTTVTASKNSIGNTTVASFVVIEFQSTACNSVVQQFSKSWTTSSTSTTQAVTSVDVNKSLLIWGGTTQNAGSTQTNAQRVTLTNATTATITVNTASSAALKCNFTVVEFIAGVLAQNAQRGTLTLTGVTSNTATITSVSKGVPNWLGFTTTAGASVLNQAEINLELTNATTLTGAKNSSSSNSTVSYEVLDFN